MKSEVNIGTSSWSFDAWRGVFYPENLGQSQFLAYYARQFNTVEVNTSFYAMPKMATVANWISAVADGFTFCLKFPRIISHEKRLKDCESETIAFLELLRALGDRAAPAFLQLPPSFSRQNEGRVLADYVDWLTAQRGGLKLAVEVRSPDLMTPAFAAFLAERGLALMLVDRVGTADMFDVWLELVLAGVAPSFAVIRWIGDDKNGPTGDRDLSAPREADLDSWARRLVRFWDAGVAVYGYMHNPYEGHAPASVRRLLGRLSAMIDIPRWAPPAPVDGSSDQLSLFDS